MNEGIANRDAHQTQVEVYFGCGRPIGREPQARYHGVCDVHHQEWIDTYMKAWRKSDE